MPFDLRFLGPDGDEQQTAQLVLVSDNPYIVGLDFEIASSTTAGR